MKIVAIKQGKRDKEKLVLSIEGGGYVSARLDDAYSYKVGDEISEDEAETLEKAYTKQKARKSAAASLAHHSMSKGTLQKKLRDRGFSEEDVTSAADWFEEKGFVDDRAYAAECARHYKRNGCGEARIREELRQRNISRELIEEILSAFDSYEEEICGLIAKKIRGKEYTPEIKRKLITYLSGRGYKYDEIRSALGKMQFNTEDMD